MRKVTFSRYDVVDYLTTEADIEAYIEATIEDGDPEEIALARSNVERARERLAAGKLSDREG
ncbi:DNA-binding protein [Burkholderia sp. LMG 13014]|uniref:helix-turn-helix domain-containing transcriptional regulator n=1 Tax=Burkholderia sp. LMG 13014 TaxID=2709306 RepID=UPI0019623CB8|nr:hypothetical protein [Burkholderia sp. LMG 13014]